MALRLAGVQRLGGGAGIRHAQVVLRTADGVEDRLRGIQEPEAVRPAMVVRAPIGVLLGHVQSVWGVVGRPRAALILTVFGDEQPPHERMVGGRKAQAEGIAIAPRDGLNGGSRVFGLEVGPQDGVGAHARLRGPCERRHDRPRSGDAMV
jgi:hypothetical protein